MTLRMFYFRGEEEMHHVIAEDAADAAGLVFEYLAQSGAAEEYMKMMPEAPWGAPIEIPDGDFTFAEENEDGSDLTLPVSEWIAREGRGHFGWTQLW